MSELVTTLIAAINGSPAQQSALNLLANVPGSVPLIQSLHILAIAIVMASAVMVDIKILGLGLGRQQLVEMNHRLRPWFWSALIVGALSGSIFILARPERYFYNPIAAWKLYLLIPAILLTAVIQWHISQAKSQRGQLLKLQALLAIGLWLMVITAGRWIAYVDYLSIT